MGFGGFSWKRAVGISKAKSKISRGVGVPLTKGGRQRKAGKAMGACSLLLVAGMMLLLLAASAASTVMAGETDAADETKADVVYITPTGKKYHLKTCRHVKKALEAGKLKEINREDARKKKYEPCKTCKPDEEWEKIR